MTTPAYDHVTDAKRSALMRRVRQRGTRAEEEVGAVLRNLGLCYRRNVRSLPGSPDFANKRKKWAIFVNGCFWHRHDGCARTTTPTRNRDFWLAKFAANKARDKMTAMLLREMGFNVLVVWECETVKSADVRRRLQPLK